MRFLTSKRGILVLVAIAVLVIGVFAFVVLSKKVEVKPIAPTSELGTVHIKEIGKSVEGREITSYTYGTGQSHLVFVGGVHGGYEWNSVLLSYRFMDYLSDTPDTIPKDLTVTVIPSANPDGV